MAAGPGLGMARRMSKIMTWCTGLALVGALAGCGQAAAVRAVGSWGLAAGSWGRAIEVPGLRALNKGGDAQVSSVSCASAGSCAAGGYYTDKHGNHGFVAVERHGVWGQAIEVPGLAALSKGGGASVSSVSCASAGSCAAGGGYEDSHRHGQGFVAVERHGRWARAIEVPGLGALNKGGDAEVSSVSCGSAGSCAAGGDYKGRDGHQHGFVASEKNGRWGKAIEVPGLGALNKGGDAEVSSVSCGSAGSCAAGGDYKGGDGHQQGFVASEKNGRWGKAIEVPGLGALNKGGDAEVSSVSCGSAGSCAAGGDYTDGGGDGHGFVADEKNGRWGKTIDVPALTNENVGVGPVSCASAGNCVAGGATDPYGSGFVVSEKNGVWGRANDVPGALNKGRSGAAVESISCGSPGNCAAAGYYADIGENLQGFVAVERNGRWGKAIEVPGLAALNKGGDASVSAVSCAPAGGCAAGGYYHDRRADQGHFQGFVVSQTG